VEFKFGMRWDFRRGRANNDLQVVIAKAIAGMLNCERGFLIIGVDDDGTTLGIKKDLRTLHIQNVDGFQLVLTDIVKVRLGAEYVPYIRPRFELIGGRYVCVIAIKESPRPVFLTRGDVHEFWVRMGNSTRRLDVKVAIRYIQEKWGTAG
jgi:predicted HTH transcriptional regulator